MGDKRKIGPWRALERLVTSLLDRSDLSAMRLAAIEDRLAQLDGGDDAIAAKQEARSTLVINRASRGESTDLNLPRD